MNYNFIKTNDIKAEYLKRHNISDDNFDRIYDLNISEDVINDFYTKLLENKELKFLIVGDYDCDGMCSVSIITSLLNSVGIINNFYIPSRIKEGYGLNKLIVDNAIKYGYKALILVDNGVSCIESIDYAYQNNIKVFIIDHHNYSVLPKCEAIIHQNLLSKDFEYSSAGELCFLLSLKNGYDKYNLVLGGLTIISDYIYVSMFNRFLLSKMYELLNSNNYLPLVLLNEGKNFNKTTITFNVIPKINSISRMESDNLNSNHLVRFLLSRYDNMNNVYEKINCINKKRKEDTINIFQNIVCNKYDDKYILISSKDISEGYCSSLATKLTGFYDKAVFVLNVSDGMCKGSGRFQNLDIYNLLKDFPKFVSFGGHEHAVGISLFEKDLNDFFSYLNSIDFDNAVTIKDDAYLIEPSLINNDLINNIEELGPFGNGYDEPLIALKNDDFKTILLKNKYTKFIISNTITAITFDEKFLGFNPEYIIGNLQRDAYKQGSFSIIIKDLK